MRSKRETVCILDAGRSAIGKPFKGLKTCRPAQIVGPVMAELIRRNGISPTSVAEVILGNAVSAGAGQNLPREAAAVAGLPFSVPAYRVSNVCGSGLQTVVNAAQTILADGKDVVLAAAAESASFSPALIFPHTTEPVSSLTYDGLRCSVAGQLMGELCEKMAAKNKITRQEQDEYAFHSQEKALAAVASGVFKSEIISVRRDDGTVFQEDEMPRKNTSLEKLANLPSSFVAGGTITAGNSCGPADGACAFLLASEDFVRREKRKPLARLVHYVSVALAPEDVFEAGAEAIKRCLAETGFTVKDIDLFDMSEAFAAQMIFTLRKTSIPPEKLNIHGGDIALGHPLGTAGGRALVTLLHGLKQKERKRGLVAVAFGGGGAMAAIVEIP